ncbi:MAG: TIGR03435 family protein [Candidatus Solibacter sp.]
MRATIVILPVLAAWAQQQPASPVEFEVISVKPGDPADTSSSTRTTPGGLQMRNTTLNNLIRGAYRLNEFQLEGGPKWTGSQRFHIDAKVPAGAARDQIPLMMQALLKDRFKLVFHRETKMLPQYELIIAPGGPKLGLVGGICG